MSSVPLFFQAVHLISLFFLVHIPPYFFSSFLSICIFRLTLVETYSLNIQKSHCSQILFIISLSLSLSHGFSFTLSFTLLSERRSIIRSNIHIFGICHLFDSLASMRTLITLTHSLATFGNS